MVKKKPELEQKDFDDAALNGCPEVANGVPPALQGAISPDQLPIAYEEPYVSEPPSSTHPARIKSIDAADPMPLEVVRTWEGKEYTYRCFVTEDLVEQYQAVNIHVGDWVLVHFDDSGRQLATQKIHKTWRIRMK